MTTRGIRRKKSYLVDAKIAVCGHKSVGKSGRNRAIESDIAVKQQTISRGDACNLLMFRHEKYFCVKYVHLEPFSSERKTQFSLSNEVKIIS